MSNDLPTRLRALADDWQRIMGSDHNTLREAADALEDRTQGVLVSKVERQRTEIDALKAKLALLNETLSGATKRARAAEAEAAAFREALTFYAEGRHVERDAMHEYAADTGKRAKQAISQPGPGAALLERVKKLEALVAPAEEALYCLPGIEEADRLSDALAALKEKP